MTSPQGHLVLVDDDQDVLLAARLLLRRQFQRVSCLSDPQKLPQFLATDPADLVLLDMNFTLGDNQGKAGLDWLGWLQQHHPNLVVVMMTAYAGVDLAVSALKAGAADFVIKPWSNEKLQASLHAAYQLAKSRQDNNQLQAENQRLRANLVAPPSTLIGESAVMRELLQCARLAAASDASVLILGENGSGKELLARAIHAHSARSQQVFMAIDMGAIPESLFEAELFGHKKGAFTGAQQARVGRLLAANGGSVFLDEIGNLPLHLQVKLLRVLEERQLVPLGEERPVPLDVRVIAATNMSRNQLADEARFRQDLLYRLNTIELTIPPLRDRREDIPLLVDHYLGVFAQKYQRPKPLLKADTLRALSNYSWPGNVRALCHAIERALVLSTNNYLTLDDFALQSPTASATTEAPSLNLEALELQAIRTALKKHQGNISQAARDLGLTRTALYRRMEKYEL